MGDGVEITRSIFHQSDVVCEEKLGLVGQCVRLFVAGDVNMAWYPMKSYGSSGLKMMEFC